MISENVELICKIRINACDGREKVLKGEKMWCTFPSFVNMHQVLVRNGSNHNHSDGRSRWIVLMDFRNLSIAHINLITNE